MPIPRPPSETLDKDSGVEVLSGAASVVDNIGQGVTSVLLMKHGCKVFNEEQIEEAQKWLMS